MGSIKAYLAIAVILACGVWLLTYFRSQPAPGETEPHRSPVACTACGKSYDGMIGDEPYKCQICGKRAAWKAVKCANAKCAEILPWVRNVGELGGQNPELRCPKCGGQEFGEVMPDDVKIP